MDAAQEIHKLVHGEGPSRITMDSNRQIVSCGRDSCSVVFHKEGLEEDTYQFDIDSITSILDVACYKQDEEYMVAIATDDHAVLSYSYCSGNVNDDPFAESQFNAILVRFTAQINTLDVNKDGTRLVAGASDFLIKMVDLTDSTKVSTIEGHEAPVLCVRFDPLNNYLASSSCDGTIKLWSIDNKIMVQSINIFPKVNDIMFTSTLCRFSWEPKHGQIIAIPFGKGVKLYERDSWKCLNTVNEQNEEDKFDHVTCWSPCGKYLAVGGSDGFISVWRWSQPSLISRHNADVGVVSSLYWDAKGDSSTHPLLFSSSSGHVGSFPHHWVYPVEAVGEQQMETAKDSNDVWDDSLLMEGIPPDSIFNDEEDENIVATAPITSSNNTLPVTAKRGDDDLTYKLAPPTTKRQRIISDASDDDCPISPQISSTSEIKGAIPPVSLPPPTVVEQHYHEIFQPSATPSHLTHRFMVYNMVGVVRCHDDGTSPMVEVDFHDSSVHHPFSIPNHYGWSMGALSSKALILAAESTEDDPSQFQCTVFSSWDHNKDWSVQLPKGEAVEVIALGDTWVAIATDSNYIRLFSLGGSQREMISLPGIVVTLAGRGDHLMIVYQESPSSVLTVWLLDIGHGTQAYPPHHLPLTPKSKLEWIGFSEGDLPISYDTKGIIRMFSNQYGLSWLPVTDCASQLGQKGDRYFVLGMTHNPNELRVILCKGLNYPPVNPRPVMSTLPLTLPLCDPQTEKTSVEAQYLEQQFVHSPGVVPSPIDSLRPLMQMMALACHSNHEFRALEIASMMSLEQGLELALQYASQSGHFRLARQISNLKERRATVAVAIEEEEEEEEETVYNGHQSERNYDTHRSSIRNYRTDCEDTDNASQPKERRSSILNVRRTLLHPNKKTDKENEFNDKVIGDDSMTDGIRRDIETSPSPSNEKLNESIESNRLTTDGQDVLYSQFSSPQIKDQRTSNPFKLTTPVSKQIQVDRRSSFLDKICQEVSEEREKEKQKKSKVKLKPASTSSKGRKKKTSNNDTGSKLQAFSFTKKT